MTIGVAWHSEPQMMYADRRSQFTTTPPEEHGSGVNFLAHEDVALKAYFARRRRYLDDIPARRACNQIGEVFPVVLHDGKVIGTWTWDATRGRVKPTLISRKCTADLRRTVRRRAEQVSQTLRSCWAGTRLPTAAPMPARTARTHSR